MEIESNQNNKNYLLYYTQYHPYLESNIKNGGNIENKSLELNEDENDNNNNIINGRWSQKEHLLFIKGCLLYGNNWKEVQNYIQTRSCSQIRSHSQKYFNKLNKKYENKEINKKITEEEIKKLVNKTKLNNKDMENAEMHILTLFKTSKEKSKENIKDEEIKENDNNLKKIKNNKKMKTQKKERIFEITKIPKELKIKKNILLQERLESNNENENEKEKNSAKNKKFKKKINKFQSVICTKKNSVFDSKNRKLTLNKKQSSNSLIKKNEENNNDSEYNIFFDNQDDKSISSSNSDENSKIKWKNKKQKFQTNIKLSKDESNTSKRNELSESRDSSIKIKEMKKIKDNKDFKNMNNILNASKYIIRHVNDIFVGKIKDKNEDYKSSIINIPRFQVVQPQNIIYFEYNRAYERPNSIQKFIIRKSDDTLNDNNIKIPNENNGNENNEKQVKKRNKSLFCCL